MREGVRYQIYEASDGHVLFMASSRRSGRTSACAWARRAVREVAGLEVRRPRAQQPRAAARAPHDLQGKSCAEWLRLGDEQNFPIAPVNTPKTIMDDAQFQDRFPWYGRRSTGST
jgi:crotonobetainyl-CoA:carnitine CoA-transferase CaiB-like acyl-CoA transferase